MTLEDPIDTDDLIVRAARREARLLAIIRHYRRQRDEREKEWYRIIKRTARGSLVFLLTPRTDSPE